jgi:hypothetical protein
VAEPNLPSQVRSHHADALPRGNNLNDGSTDYYAAQAMAAEIMNYWVDRGFNQVVAYPAFRGTIQNVGSTWGVASNLRSGLPPNAKALDVAKALAKDAHGYSR